MKNLMIFLFGAAFGSVGTLFYLRKDIKKKLEEMNNQQETVQNEQKNDDENGSEKDTEESNIPFEMRDEMVSNALRETTKVNYNKILNDNYRGRPPVPVTNLESDFQGMDETDGGCFEIDINDFMNDETNEKERLVYFKGDRIMATENGTIITNPAMYVGTMWENCVGNYADRTAFIRNARLVTDYEIYVEDGLYSDEYGDENNFRED